MNTLPTMPLLPRYRRPTPEEELRAELAKWRTVALAWMAVALISFAGMVLYGLKAMP